MRQPFAAICAVALASCTATSPAASAPSPAAGTAAPLTPTVSPTAKPLTATVELRDKDGQVVATAMLTQLAAGGVRVQFTGTKLPPGVHGWHIHTVGKCDGPDFATAGGHFNPDGKKHGAQNPEGAHAGDLGNFTAAADGTAKVEVTARVSLEPGAASSLFRTDGSAIVIHANADDERTDPAGNSGGRIACGVIK